MRNHYRLVAVIVVVGFLALSATLAPAGEINSRRTVVERFATPFTDELAPLFCHDENA